MSNLICWEKTIIKFDNSWDSILKEEFKKEYYLNLRKFLIEEYEKQKIYPNMHDIYNAFKFTPYEEVKVVILGQDPYHGEGQAHGLSFSVRPGVKSPPSLINIFKELKDDLGYEMPPNGCLEPWAREGIFLLNTCLTVREGEPNSHRDKGWEILTDRVIEILDEREDPIVFILWGNNAKQKETLIKNKKHLIIKGTHPSPLSAHSGFFGGKYFSKTKKFLEKNGKTINWKINES